MSKICFYFESYYVGGLDTFVVQLINNWPCNDEITLLCNKSHSGAYLFKNRITNPNCTVEIHNLPMIVDWAGKSYRFTNSSKVYALFRIVAYLVLTPRYILKSYKELNLSRFDSLMTINGGYPACLSSRCVSISWWRSTGKQCIHNFHNFAVESSKLIRPIDNMIDKLLVKSVSNFVSVSHVCAESLKKRQAFKNLENIMYVYNGIGNEVVEPSFDLRESIGLSKDTKLMLMLATYEHRKGHKFIIKMMYEVCQKLDNVHLLFLGYGKDSEISEVRDFVFSMNLSDKITLLSYKENAMEYLAQADLVLIGSQEFESFGLTAIEAMKYHKVILSTNIGGLIEVNKDGEGSFLFNPDDCTGMAQKAISLLTDETLMRLQSELAYKRFSLNFRASIMSRAYKDLMK